MDTKHYERVASCDGSTDVELEPRWKPHQPFASPKAMITLLSMTTCFFAVLSCFLAYGISSLRQSASSNYERGFRTDLESIKSHIGTKSVTFTGALKYDPEDVLYRDMASRGPQYVGPPSRAIDDAWTELLKPLGMNLPDQQAGKVAGKTFQEPDGSWLMTLDVYHSLHCVNMVRQAVDKAYYHPGLMISADNGIAHGTTDEDPHIFRIHTDHCLDYLRQTIQCSSDLTPLTYAYSESRRERYPVFGGEHTCRNFEVVHEWAMQRLGNHTS